MLQPDKDTSNILTVEMIRDAMYALEKQRMSYEYHTYFAYVSRKNAVMLYKEAKRAYNSAKYGKRKREAKRMKKYLNKLKEVLNGIQRTY